MKKFTLLSSVIICSSAAADSGWVGNSPMRVASFNSPSFFAGSGASSQEFGNALLQQKGSAQITFSKQFAFFSNTHSGNIFTLSSNVDFQYGLSERWTLDNFTSLLYSLKANGGLGEEYALSFGFRNFYYGSGVGLFLVPHVGLIRSWSSDRWKFTQSIEFMSELSNRTKVNPSGSYLQANAALNHKLSDNWSAALQLGIYWGFSNWGTGMYGFDFERVLGDNVTLGLGCKQYQFTSGTPNTIATTSLTFKF